MDSRPGVRIARNMPFQPPARRTLLTVVPAAPFRSYLKDVVWDCGGVDAALPSARPDAKVLTPRTSSGLRVRFFEAGKWVNGVAGRLNPRSHGPAWLWCSTHMSGRPVICKTGDVFKATVSASTIAAYLRGAQLFTGNDSKRTSGSPGIASSLRRHWAEC